MDKLISGRTKEMKLEQFIGIFPNAISDDLCSKFVNYFNAISEQGLTMSSMEDAVEKMSKGTFRKDEVLHIPSELPIHCFPKALCQSIWSNVLKCYMIYNKEYNIERDVTSYSFNIHRVYPSGGYHVWHHEHGFESPYRILAWHLNIEVPKRGGETEFLLQSMRVEPQVGQLTIWPAGFTHKHRGNPPLEGRKTYLTGWFELTQPQFLKE